MAKPVRQQMKDTFEDLIKYQSQITRRYSKNIFTPLMGRVIIQRNALNTVKEFQSNDKNENTKVEDLGLDLAPLATGFTDSDLTITLDNSTGVALEASYETVKQFAINNARVNDVYIVKLKGAVEALVAAATKGDMFGKDLSDTLLKMETVEFTPVTSDETPLPELKRYGIIALTPFIIGRHQIHLYPKTSIQSELEDDEAKALAVRLSSPLVTTRPSKLNKVTPIVSKDSPESLSKDTLKDWLNKAIYVVNKLDTLIEICRQGFDADTKSYNSVINTIQYMANTEIDLRGNDGKQFRILQSTLSEVVLTGILHQQLALVTLIDRLLDATAVVTEICKAVFVKDEDTPPPAPGKIDSHDIEEPKEESVEDDKIDQSGAEDDDEDTPEDDTSDEEE